MQRHQHSVGRTCANCCTHVHRLWEKALHVEVEWSVGPIPIEDKKGKEVVLRYASSLDSGENLNAATAYSCSASPCGCHLVTLQQVRLLPLLLLKCAAGAAARSSAISCCDA